MSDTPPNTIPPWGDELIQDWGDRVRLCRVHTPPNVPRAWRVYWRETVAGVDLAVSWQDFAAHSEALRHAQLKAGEPAAAEDPLHHFCVRCFASEEDGSWGGIVVGGHCTNCGAGGAIQIPAWAVRDIRRNASWVGRRYYPSDEDKANLAELRALRAKAGVPADRTATLEEDGLRWRIRQPTPGGWIETSVARRGDETAQDALARTVADLPHPADG